MRKSSLFFADDPSAPNGDGQAVHLSLDPTEATYVAVALERLGCKVFHALPDGEVYVNPPVIRARKVGDGSK